MLYLPTPRGHSRFPPKGSKRPLITVKTRQNRSQQNTTRLNSNKFKDLRDPSEEQEQTRFLPLAIMFYSNFMLVKKGPLSQVWLAAHWQQRLTKGHVRDCDIDISAKHIQSPATPYALRLSGQLLLGLVRIYKKKVQYLHEDACDALTKINLNLGSATVDLPENKAVASNKEITLPDKQDVLPEIDLLEFESLLDMEVQYQQPRGRDEARLSKTDSSHVQNEEDLTLPSQEPLRQHLEQLPDEPMEVDNLLLDSVELPRNELVPEEDAALELDLGLDEMEHVAKGDVSSVISMDATLQSGTTHDADVSLPDSARKGKTPQKDEEAVEEGEEKAVKSDEENMPPPSIVPKRKPNKRKAVKMDARTELRSKTIEEQIKDTSDIVLRDRPLLPLRKRQKLQDEALRHPLASIQDPAIGMESLGFGACTGEPPLASELLELLEIGYSRTGVADLPLRQGAVREAAEELEEEAAAAAAVAEEKEEAPMVAEEEAEDAVEKARKQEEPPEDLSMDDVDLYLGPEPLLDDFTHSSDWTRDSLSVVELQQQERLGAEDMRNFFGESAKGEEEEEEREDGELTRKALKRTQKTHQVIKKAMAEQQADVLSYRQLVNQRSRTAAAVVFYQLLVLKSHQVISVQQPSAFGDIKIGKGLKFARSASNMYKDFAEEAAGQA
eukprot:g21522.t1